MMLEIWRGWFGSKTGTPARLELWRKASHTLLYSVIAGPPVRFRLSQAPDSPNIFIEHTDFAFEIIGEGEGGVDATDENGHGWLITMHKGEPPAFHSWKAGRLLTGIES